MRRVNCKQCGVLVEEVPWGRGKHNSTKVHMHFLGHWARKLSWKETAEEFRTSWDSVLYETQSENSVVFYRQNVVLETQFL
jgi:hypothetical protein